MIFEVYPITVTTHYLKDKDALRFLTPLFIWMGLGHYTAFIGKLGGNLMLVFDEDSKQNHIYGFMENGYNFLKKM